MGTMTWTEPKRRQNDPFHERVKSDPPSSVVSRLADWNTAQMCADAKHNQPLRLLDSVLVALRVPESLPVDTSGLFYLIRGPVANKHWFTAPFDDDVLALGDAGELDLSLGKSEDVRRCCHRLQEAGDSGLCDGSGENAKRADHEI